MTERVFAQRAFTIPGGAVEIWCMDRDHVADFATTVWLDRPEQSSNVGSPLVLSKEAAQELMDCLIAAGIRPNNGEGGPAHTKALEKHIEDLRTIAFKVLKVEP